MMINETTDQNDDWTIPSHPEVAQLKSHRSSWSKDYCHNFQKTVNSLIHEIILMLIQRSEKIHKAHKCTSVTE